MIGFPLLFVNFKAYPEATGKKAASLAKIIENASLETGVNSILCVQASDIFRVSETVGLPVFSQAFDFEEPGAKTGHLVIESLVESGASGSLLNHAENKMENEFLESCLERAGRLKFPVLLCVENMARLKEISGFKVKPWAVAIEPPELIGGNASVSTARPELITETVDFMRKNLDAIVVTGAGIKNAKDVEIALRLGTKGVLVASGIVKAKDPFKETIELMDGFG